MTNEKAISAIKENACYYCDLKHCGCEKCAYGIAIEAIRRQQKVEHGTKVRLSPFECLTRSLRMCGVYMPDNKVEEVTSKFMILLKENRFVKDGAWSEY